MQLPYWDGEIDIETGLHEKCAAQSSSAVRLTGICSPLIGSLNARLMSFESELLYSSGMRSGVCGSFAGIRPELSRQEVFSVSPFLLVMGYSTILDPLAAKFVEERPDVNCGIARCTFRLGNRQCVSYKAVTMLGESPLFDDLSLLEEFNAFLAENAKLGSRLIPYYAGTFGYLRAPLLYETDSPSHIIAAERMSSLLFEETRRAVGSPVLLAMPSPGAAAELPAELLRHH